MNFKEILIQTYGEETLRPIIKLAKKIRNQLIRQDRDVVIGITGFEGEGKSTLAVILSILIDPKFDFDLNVSYLPSAEEITKEFNRLKPGQVYLVDEAIKGLYKMNFQSSLQQTIIKMYATERYQNKCTLLLMPRFTDFTENFRNHRIRTWINVIERGKAIVYIKDRDQTTQDPWHLAEARKQKMRILKKRISNVTIDERIREERKLPTYLTDFSFPDLPHSIKEIYQDKKIESRMREDVAPVEEKKEHKFDIRVRKALVELAIYMEKRLKLKRYQIGKIAGYEDKAFSKILNNPLYNDRLASTGESPPSTSSNIYDKEHILEKTQEVT